MNKYEQFGIEYQDLAQKIYEGIYTAHPNISEELADDYARTAFYMIRKNKTEMSIHAPKKSYRRFKQLLLNLKRNNAIQKDGLINIDDLRKVYIKK